MVVDKFISFKLSKKVFKLNEANEASSIITENFIVWVDCTDVIECVKILVKIHNLWANRIENKQYNSEGYGNIGVVIDNKILQSTEFEWIYDNFSKQNAIEHQEINVAINNFIPLDKLISINRKQKLKNILINKIQKKAISNNFLELVFGEKLK